MTTTTTTRTEYGFRVTGGPYAAPQHDLWPRDGKVRPYGNPGYLGPGSGPAVDATDVVAMHAAAKRFVEAQHAAGRTRAVAVIARDVELVTTVSERPGPARVVVAPVELPTTPGSVVRASRFGDVAFWTLTDDGDDNPWRSVSGSYAGPEDLSGVEVLFVAPAV